MNSLPKITPVRNGKIKRRPDMAKVICVSLLMGFWIGITPYVFLAARHSRGYQAIGGEIIFPFIPLLLYGLGKAINDLRKVI